MDGVVEFLRYYREMFTDAPGGRWALCEGVCVPRCRDLAPAHEDYSLHDTPPGQKVR